MAIEHHNHLADTWSWLVNNWQLIIFTIGAIIGSIWWFLNLTFSTNRTTSRCKQEVLQALKIHEEKENLKMDQFVEENREQHKEIREDMRWLRRQLTDYITKNNGNIEK